MVSPNKRNINNPATESNLILTRNSVAEKMPCTIPCHIILDLTICERGRHISKTHVTRIPEYAHAKLHNNFDRKLWLQTGEGAKISYCHTSKLKSAYFGPVFHGNSTELANSNEMMDHPSSWPETSHSLSGHHSFIVLAKRPQFASL